MVEQGGDMHLGHHKIPFEDIPAGTTERQLRQMVADLRRENNQLKDDKAVLEAENHHLRGQLERKGWRR